MNMSAWLSPLETATLTSGAASLSLSLGDEIRWKNGLLDKRATPSVHSFPLQNKVVRRRLRIVLRQLENERMPVMEVDGDPARVVE